MTRRLLYVEDDEDLSRLLGLVLTNEGYEVMVAATAEEAFVQLRNNRYDLLLTDYNLPNENADWMLKEAEEDDLLRQTAVVVLTASERPEGLDGYRLLRKPVDIAVLFAALDEAAGTELPVAVEDPDVAPVLALRLYITGGSWESKKALRNLTRALGKFERSKIRLDLCDVSDGQRPSTELLEADRVIVTPTLVRAFPTPKVWLFGDLSKSDVLEDMIATGLEGLDE